MSTALAVVESWLTGFGFVLNIPRMNTPHTVSMFIAVLLVGCGQGEQKTIHQVPAVPVTGSPPTTASPEDDLIGGLFELGTSLVKTADELGQAVFGLTPSEQKEIGERLHTQLKAKHGLHRDRKQLTRIERLAAPLQKQMKRDDVTLSFHLLDLDEVNAFSHVGGHIYFNRGLLEIIEADAELQFVIGHEIAHLELGHCEKLLTYAVRAGGLGNELGGTLGAEAAEAIAGVAYQALSAGYSAEQELACDEWAYRAMRKDGCSHAECIAMAKYSWNARRSRPEKSRRMPQSGWPARWTTTSAPTPRRANG
mgnify:FL=1|jgi:Zn-dependent protease with chaperone function